MYNISTAKIIKTSSFIGGKIVKKHNLRLYQIKLMTSLNCTAIGNSGHSLKQDCGPITI